MPVVRLPLVAFAYAADKLRRLPGGRLVDRHVTLTVAVLMLAGLVMLAAWASQRSPQRIDLPSLANGQLPWMQSWIIISGDLGDESLGANEYRYRLTDPAVPNAELIVVSAIQRPLGQTTLSGTYVGTREPLAGNFRWIGQMRADTELAREQDPPWIAIVLVLGAVLVALGARTSYPTLFHQTPRPQPVRQTFLPVKVRRGLGGETGPPSPASLAIDPGSPVELIEPNRDPLPLRLHSAHTSVEAGELQRLGGSEPALLVHLSTAELTLSFASAEDRDSAHAALTADVETRLGRSDTSG